LTYINLILPYVVGVGKGSVGKFVGWERDQMIKKSSYRFCTYIRF